MTEKIDYLQYGKGKDTTALFIHGFNCTPKIHTKYLETIAKKYEVIAPNLINKNIRPITIDDYTNEVADFLYNNKIQPQTFIGYSLGGAVAFNYATENTLDSIVAINPVVPVEYGYLGYIRRGLNMITNEVTNYIQKMWDNPNDFKEIIKETNKVSSDILINIYDSIIDSMLTIADIAKFDLNYKFVSTPTRILIGTSDEFYGKIDMEAKLKKHFQELSVMELENYSHCMINEHFEQIAEMTIDFMEIRQKINYWSQGNKIDISWDVYTKS